VFIGAFFVNLLSSTVYDLLILHTSQLSSQLSTQRYDLDVGTISFSIIAIAFSVFLVLRQLSKCKPPQPFLSFLIKPEDTEPFLQPKVFQAITERLEKGLGDFRVIGNGFFESLNAYFPFLFTNKTKKEPEKEHEELEDSNYKQFPKTIKEYDVSAMSTTGVKITLEVILSPEIIHSLTPKGDETAVHSFYLVFGFKVLNPRHSDANKFLDVYYRVHASYIIQFCSYCIADAFRKEEAKDH
jgi:hypothetical protein